MILSTYSYLIIFIYDAQFGERDESSEGHAC